MTEYKFLKNKKTTVVSGGGMVDGRGFLAQVALRGDTRAEFNKCQRANTMLSR